MVCLALSLLLALQRVIAPAAAQTTPPSGFVPISAVSPAPSAPAMPNGPPAYTQFPFPLSFVGSGELPAVTFPPEPQDRSLSAVSAWIARNLDPIVRSGIDFTELKDKRSVLFNPKKISREEINTAEREGRVERIAPQYPFGPSNPLFSIQEADKRSSYPDIPTPPSVPYEAPTNLSGMLDGANKGNPAVQWALGTMYEEGRNGAPKNDTEAARWYLKSAQQGFKLAEYSIGRSYAYALGVERDYSESLKWLTLAALQGVPEAKLEISWRYLYGQGVKQNTDSALGYMREAADEGSVDAQTFLAAGLRTGRLNGAIAIDTDLSEAMVLYRKAAVSGSDLAEESLGEMYANGIGVPKDEIEGLAWLNIAAAADTGNAQITAGNVAERDELERRIGTAASLLAQQRSKEILVELKSEEGVSKSNAAGVTPSDTRTPKASGSGSIVSRGGLVLTAAHVIAGANSLKVYTAQGLRGAKVLRIDEANDIAMLQLDVGTYAALPMAASRRVRLGQMVATIGFPNIQIQGFSPKVTRGEISSLNGVGDDPRSWQISVPVQPGNSGGPLLDENGNLVGIVESKLSFEAAKATNDLPQNVSYAVKGTYALALLEPYLDNNALEANQPSQAPRFEDMVARAQQSVVLILVY